MDEKVTKPTIETVLERMAGMEQRLSQRMDGMNQSMAGMEQRFSQRMDGMSQRMDGMSQRIEGMEKGLGVRLDRIESVVHTTRGEMLELRADFRELSIKL
jgi:CRP-like cAMP-binding protein